MSRSVAFVTNGTVVENRSGKAFQERFAQKSGTIFLQCKEFK